jgi:DNA repair protein RecO (recombination protein O)
MDWIDEGIIVSARRHGETSLIVDLLTREHGRHSGLVRGGTSRRHSANLQPGNSVQGKWRARLADHLGSYTIEPLKTRAAGIMSNRMALAGLNSVCAMAVACLPEREPHQPLYDAMTVLLDLMDHNEVWPALYVKWELGLLRDLGFGLDFSHCAATGKTENLTHLSPKSGRAVSAAAAAPYKEKLFVLPGFLQEGVESRSAPVDEVLEGLRMTEHFIDRRLLRVHGLKLPDARQRLVEELGRPIDRA